MRCTAVRRTTALMFVPEAQATPVRTIRAIHTEAAHRLNQARTAVVRRTQNQAVTREAHRRLNQVRAHAAAHRAVQNRARTAAVRQVLNQVRIHVLRQARRHPKAVVQAPHAVAANNIVD